MIKRGIALRYSKALFEMDKSEATLKKRLAYFQLLQNLLKANPKLEKFLQSPQIDKQNKEELLLSIFNKDADPPFLLYLMNLAQMRRLDYIDQIAMEFHLMVDEFLNIWEAKIITAVPLEEQTGMMLKKKLEDFYKKKIKITNEINPKIIGGAILLANNEMIDWSVASRLKEIKENLLKTHV